MLNKLLGFEGAKKFVSFVCTLYQCWGSNISGESKIIGNCWQRGWPGPITNTYTVSGMCGHPRMREDAESLNGDESVDMTGNDVINAWEDRETFNNIIHRDIIEK